MGVDEEETRMDHAGVILRHPLHAIVWDNTLNVVC